MKNLVTEKLGLEKAYQEVVIEMQEAGYIRVGKNYLSNGLILNTVMVDPKDNEIEVQLIENTTFIARQYNKEFTILIINKNLGLEVTCIGKITIASRWLDNGISDQNIKLNIFNMLTIIAKEVDDVLEMEQEYYDY